MGWNNYFDVSKLEIGASAAEQKMENGKWKSEIRKGNIFGELGVMLVRTGCGEDEDLAGAEATGVAQLGIGLDDARPCGAAAQPRRGNPPERVAALDGDA
jgi:hypothetical protein